MRKFIPALRFDFATRLYDPVVRWTTCEAEFKSALVRSLDARPGERILDVGSGTGTLSIAIARAQPDAEVHGLDADSTVIARSRAKQAEAGVTVYWQQGFAQRLAHPNATFDAVVSSLFFHHLRREEKVVVLAEIARVLRPGGRLLVADWGRPASAAARARFILVQALDGFETTRDSVEGVLPQLIADAGFADVAVEREFSTPLGTLALYRAGLDLPPWERSRS